jgi:hypothetical protein
MQLAKLDAACAAMRARSARTWKDRRDDVREDEAMLKMGRFLVAEQRAARRERYVTAMCGVKTSWPRIEEYGKFWTITKTTRREWHARRVPCFQSWKTASVEPDEEEGDA